MHAPLSLLLYILFLLIIVFVVFVCLFYIVYFILYLPCVGKKKVSQFIFFIFFVFLAFGMPTFPNFFFLLFKYAKTQPSLCILVYIRAVPLRHVRAVLYYMIIIINCTQAYFNHCFILRLEYRFVWKCSYLK